MIYFAVLAAVLANVLDVWSTDRLLATGKFREANPIMRLAQKYMGPLWPVWKAPFILAGLAVVILLGESVTLYLFVVAVLVGAVACWNLWLGRAL